MFVPMCKDDRNICLSKDGDGLVQETDKVRPNHHKERPAILAYQLMPLAARRPISVTSADRNSTSLLLVLRYYQVTSGRLFYITKFMSPFRPTNIQFHASSFREEHDRQDLFALVQPPQAIYLLSIQELRVTSDVYTLVSHMMMVQLQGVVTIGEQVF